MSKTLCDFIYSSCFPPPVLIASSIFMYLPWFPPVFLMFRIWKPRFLYWVKVNINCWTTKQEKLKRDWIFEFSFCLYKPNSYGHCCLPHPLLVALVWCDDIPDLCLGRVSTGFTFITWNLNLLMCHFELGQSLLITVSKLLGLGSWVKKNNLVQSDLTYKNSCFFWEIWQDF